MTTRFQVVNEITLDPPGNWQLCLQWGRYVEDGGEIYEGHRFIYRRPNGSLQREHRLAFLMCTLLMP